MRKANENKLNADIICVPGGKLGHLVNSLNYNEKILKYDDYVIMGGLNNVDNGLTKDTERSQVFKQLNELGKAVREILDGDEKKKLFLVAPINAPSKDPVKISDTTEMMRNMEVNNRKQGNIKLIDTLFTRVDDDIYEDDLHLTQIGTIRLIKEMDSRIGGLMRGERVTTGRIYSKAETEYMCCCSFCCKKEHDDEGCDLLPRKRDSLHLSPPESGKNKSKKGEK